MPKPSPSVIAWSEKHQYYELSSHGQLQQCFHPGDEEVFSRWLDEQTTFAFVGKGGRLSIIKEARSAGAGYWYAYRTKARHTHKRYLGPSTRVTFARLEQEALALSLSPSTHGDTPGQEEQRPPTSLQAGQRETLFSLKHAPPHLPGSFVERSRLLSELDEAFSHRLTLLSASAGSGKTTLLSAWINGKQHMEQGKTESAYAWLSLDKSDNDPLRFWHSVLAAVQTCLPTYGEAVQHMLHSPQAPPLSTILTALLDEMERVGREIILLLDDYHVISDQAVHESLLTFLTYAPTNVHLILASRSDPELPLSRFRVHAQMIEIRDQDLRFTQHEATSFLRDGMGLPLSEEEVAQLSVRTEGWIAGLQLAALALRKCGDLSAAVSEFGGTHRYLLDYVRQDILAHLPLTLQNFLLQTSILTRMNAAVSQAVTAEPDLAACQYMLEELERTNLFVVPLDSERQWYRFHDLFREALRARLQASQPDLIPLLHSRAARWYETQGALREAISHALAAADYPYAAHLMELVAPACWLNGEGRTLHSWVFSLPDAVLCVHAPLALDATLHLLNNSVNLSNKTLFASLATQVDATFKRMDQILCEKQALSLTEAEAGLIERRLHLLRALVESRAVIKRGDRERLQLLVEETEVLPRDEAGRWEMIPLSFAVWLTAMLKGEGSSLIDQLLEKKQRLSRVGDPLITVRLMAWLALAYTHAAQLRLAQQECLEALALIEQTQGHTPLEGYLYYSLFNVSYARNRLEEASHWLKRLTRSAQDWQQVELLVMAAIYSVRLGLAQGDLPTAQQALQTLEPLVEQEGFANHAFWVHTLQVQLWLAQGDLTQASRWAAQTTFSPDRWDPLHRWQVLMLGRVLLAQQQYTQANELLTHFKQHFDRLGDIPTKLEWQALYIVALYHSGEYQQALHVATHLTQTTGAEGYILLCLDVDEPILKQIHSLLHAHPPQTQRGGAELLSRQEQQVLRRLCSGQTYAEIAAALIVSPNTIKTQVSSIYRKLGVSRRAEAIAAAHRLRLL